MVKAVSKAVREAAHKAKVVALMATAKVKVDNKAVRVPSVKAAKATAAVKTASANAKVVRADKVVRPVTTAAKSAVMVSVGG